MLLKTIIVLLFIANIIALSRALVTMMQDQNKRSDRTANMLLIRVVLAVLLIGTVGFGMATGQLGSSAPWLNY